MIPLRILEMHLNPAVSLDRVSEWENNSAGKDPDVKMVGLKWYETRTNASNAYDKRRRLKQTTHPAPGSGLVIGLCDTAAKVKWDRTQHTEVNRAPVRMRI